MQEHETMASGQSGTRKIRQGDLPLRRSGATLTLGQHEWPVEWSLEALMDRLATDERKD